MAARSAPMLTVLAMNSSATSPSTTGLAITCAHVARQAAAGDPPDLAADQLDGGHQRIGQQHGPQQAVAEPRAGLGIGGDARGIVVGRAGDQPGPSCSNRAMERILRRRDMVGL
jgi:hypothetical protein